MLGIVENSLKSWQGNVILSTQFATKVPMQIGLGKVETNSLERHQAFRSISLSAQRRFGLALH